MNTTDSGFVGWHRTDSRATWHAVVSDATEDDAFRQLLSVVTGGDKVVLPQGRHPNERTPATQRRRF